jgi:hypothetical protein
MGVPSRAIQPSRCGAAREDEPGAQRRPCRPAAAECLTYDCLACGRRAGRRACGGRCVQVARRARDAQALAWQRKRAEHDGPPRFGGLLRARQLPSPSPPGPRAIAVVARWEVPERRVQPARVTRPRSTRRSRSSARSSWPAALADEFLLERAERTTRRPHCRARSPSVPSRCRCRPGASAGQRRATRTAALVGVVDETGVGLAAHDRHLNRLDHELCAHVLGHRPADYAAAGAVEHDRQIDVASQVETSVGSATTADPGRPALNRPRTWRRSARTRAGPGFTPDPTLLAELSCAGKGVLGPPRTTR